MTSVALVDDLLNQFMHTTDSWDIMSAMPTARYNCLDLVAVLPGNQLMVVGGITGTFSTTDKVEFATF